jgi:hypothetical protein
MTRAEERSELKKRSACNGHQPPPSPNQPFLFAWIISTFYFGISILDTRFSIWLRSQVLSYFHRDWRSRGRDLMMAIAVNLCFGGSTCDFLTFVLRLLLFWLFIAVNSASGFFYICSTLIGGQHMFRDCTAFCSTINHGSQHGWGNAFLVVFPISYSGLFCPIYLITPYCVYYLLCHGLCFCLLLRRTDLSRDHVSLDALSSLALIWHSLSIDGSSGYDVRPVDAACLAWHNIPTRGVSFSLRAKKVPLILMINFCLWLLHFYCVHVWGELGEMRAHVCMYMGLCMMRGRGCVGERTVCALGERGRPQEQYMRVL